MRDNFHSDKNLHTVEIVMCFEQRFECNTMYLGTISMEVNELYQMVPELDTLSTFSTNLGYRQCTETGSVL